MANTVNTKTLGELIRNARVDKDLSLRDLAKRLDKTPSYLSDIENDRRVPSEEVLHGLADLLDLDFDLLMSLGGRFGDDAERYLKRNPVAGALFRKISESGLQESELRRLLSEAERLAKKKGV